jgi:hypothetical protein
MKMKFINNIFTNVQKNYNDFFLNILNQEVQAKIKIKIIILFLFLKKTMISDFDSKDFENIIRSLIFLTEVMICKDILTKHLN